MVEKLNCSLLQLLHTYVKTESDWEKHLPLALYAYHMAIHASTGVSPHTLMFGRQPQYHTLQCSSLPVALIPPPINFISMTSWLNFKIYHNHFM